MDIPVDMDEYIKQSIEYSVGLPVSTQTLEYKLRAAEDALQRLRDQYLRCQMKLTEKDETIERARFESSLNAQALKNFVIENKKLAEECTALLERCKKWEKECALYDHDREALMEFGNESDERAREAEIRVHELEEAFGRVTEELKFYKNQCETHSADSSSAESSSSEQLLVESLMATLVSDGEAAPVALAFLEANGGVDVCQKLLKAWNSLRPSTQKIVALAAEVKALQKDKEHLRINLTRAEEEVHLLFEENKILNKENKRLMRNNERCLSGSGEKQVSTISGKGSKRKSSPRICSPIGMDLGGEERTPLSSLQQNSPEEGRMHKK